MDEEVGGGGGRPHGTTTGEGRGGGPGGGTCPKFGYPLLTLWPLKQDMKSLFQAKYRQTLIIKCFRYNLFITGSHFGERFTNIAKMGGGN